MCWNHRDRLLCQESGSLTYQPLGCWCYKDMAEVERLSSVALNMINLRSPMWQDEERLQNLKWLFVSLLWIWSAFGSFCFIRLSAVGLGHLSHLSFEFWGVFLQKEKDLNIKIFLCGVQEYFRGNLSSLKIHENRFERYLKQNIQNYI